jgi:hypothetical protein
MKIGYIKYSKYIITIEDLSIIPYYDLMKFSSSTNHFKIISIEDIINNNYDSIQMELFNGRFFDRDIYEIHLSELINIQLNDIINNSNSFQLYFYDKNDAFFYNFFKEQQFKLFDSGYTNFCRFNICPVYSFEFLVNNNKIIGTVKMYINNKFYSEIMFDKIKDNIIEYQIEGDKIELTKEKFMFKIKEIGLFCYLDYYLDC